MGIAIRKCDNGNFVRVNCKPFSHTGKKVVRIPKYELLIQNKWAAKVRAGEKITKVAKTSVWKGGYKQRYGNELRALSKEKLIKRLIV